MHRPIGIFDSGVGGLTVLHAIAKRLPREDLIYLGDTARVPYGIKSPETVTRYALESARSLMAQEIKVLVVACNTASAVAVPALSASLSVPVIGVLAPGARAAARYSGSGSVGVIGTESTIRSGAYRAAIHAIRPGIRVFPKACPLFVPLAEEGWADHPLTVLVAREYLTDLQGTGIDTLVLGCTHYPLLKSAIARVMGEGVRLVDSAEETALEVEDVLRARGILRTSEEEPRRHFLVTDDPERFRTVGERFLGSPLSAVEQIEL